MPVIARSVVIDHETGRLLVDGEEFPWFIAPNVSIETGSGASVAYVSIELLADHVEVIPRARLEDDGDEDQAEVEG